MKSVFRTCSVDRNDYYKYSHSYILLKTIEFIYNKKNVEFEDILNNLSNYILLEDIDFNLLNRFFKKNLSCFNEKFSLKNYQINLYERLNKIEHLYFKYSNMNESDLSCIFDDFTLSLKYSLEETIAYLIVLENRQSNKPEDFYFIEAWYMLKFEDTALRSLDTIINCDDYSSLKICDYIRLSSFINDYFEKNNIKEFKDLDRFSMNFAYASLGECNNKLNNICYNMTLEKIVENLDHYLINTISDVLFNLNQIMLGYDVFYGRLANIGKKDTLEKIANEYSVTKQRISQIEQVISLKINEKMKEYNEYINILLLALVENFDGYCTYNKMVELLEENHTNELIYLINNYESNFYVSYDYNYKIFYYVGSFVPVLEVKKVKDKLGDIVTISTLKSLNDFEKNVVLENYSLKFDNDVYVINGLNQNEIIFRELDDLFPNGYSLGSDEDYNLLNNKIKEKYETKYNLATKHAFQGLIARQNYCFIDKGKVINRIYVPTLDANLITNILGFISEADDIIYYNTIFEKFKKELLNYGVDNRYYLKGIIDNYLPKEYSHQRDYISVGKTFKTPYDVIRQDIFSQSGVINMDVLREKYPGVKDYTFMNYIDSIDDSIWIKYNDSFILGRNITVSDNAKNIIVTNINNLLNIMKSKTISVSKLYSRMKILSAAIFKELDLFDSPFAFYSLLSYLFKDRYYFSRPYLSIDKDANLTGLSILLNYVSSLNRINIDIIGNYLNKMHLTPLGSYLEFMDNNSNMFVQINKEDAVKRDLVKVNDSILNEIKYQINYYIDSYGPIDTRKYLDFYNYPRINFSWNKYLLVGIIRTFLKDDFEIEYTDSMYNHTDFIIRRVI